MKGTAVGILVVLLLAGCASYHGQAAQRDGDVRRIVQPSPGTVAVAVEPPRVASTEGTRSGSPLPAAAALHGWDRRRAQAWATGDIHALADLYTAGSGAGRADVALLKQYLQRGLRVTGLRMQVFSVQVLDHARRRWRLRVVDRLARAVAVGTGEAVRLPQDIAATRVIDLVRGADRRWRVASVRLVGR